MHYFFFVTYFNKFRYLIDSSTNYQGFKRLTLLLTNVEIEQWNASKLNIGYIFRENFPIHVPCKHSLDWNKTSFSLLFLIISTPLKLWDITSTEKALKSFILSFSKKWSLSSSNKFLTSANALTVLLFRGGSIGIDLV